VIGHRLAHFELRELVGVGGMGEVYRAHDEHLNRDVAVKVLPQGFLTDEAARRRFHTEALALSKLNHPSIATVFDFDSQHGVDFLVMELVQGHPLSVHAPGQPLDEADVIRLGLQLADGLVAAHAQGIIHRDLKPANLMMMPDGRLKILDFGLATVTSTDEGDLTRTRSQGAIEGTIPYMSPEQLRGLAPDPRSDVYAVGAVLYELLTGSRPHPEVQSNELIGAILHRHIDAPRAHNQKISPALERIVMRALEKQPDRRYQSARELLVALDQLNAHVDGPKGWRRDKRLSVGSLGWAVLFVLAVAAAYGLPALGRLLYPVIPSRSTALAPQPPRDAGRMYIDGLDRLRNYDLVGARDRLQKAVDANPDHALAHSALSRAWWTSGFTEQSKAEAKRAFELASSLPRQDRLAIEGQLRSTTGEHDRAIECYQTLLNLVADNLEYGLWLVAAQTDARKGRDALATIEVLRRLPPSAGADPRIDLLEANAASSLDDYAHMRAAADRVVASAQRGASTQLIAHAQLVRGRALFALNDPGQAIAAYEAARTIFAAQNDRAGEATALSAWAEVVWRRGDLVKAEDMFKEVLAIDRTVDHKDGIAGALMNLGRVRYVQNDLVPAKDFIEQSLQIRRTLGDRRGTADCLNGIALVLQEQHDLEAARKVHAEVLVIRRELADRPGIAQTLYNMALLEGERNLADARRMYEESLAIRRELGDQGRVALTVRQLSGIRGTQGELREAQAGLEEALQTQLALGQQGQAAYTRTDLAWVLTELGVPDRAEPAARLAIAEFRAEKAPDAEAAALIRLAEAQFALGKLEDARRSIDAASGIQTAIDPQSPLLGARILAAQIDAVRGRIDDARKTLASAVSTASRLQLRAAEFEARYVLADLDGQAGNTTAARGRLVTLQKEAADLGFLLVAGKAKALLQRLGSSR